MNTQYITLAGDRWDTIAFKAYGDCTTNQIKIIKDANPYVIVGDEFSEGVILNVPIMEQTSSINDLPPWKRKIAEDFL